MHLLHKTIEPLWTAETAYRPEQWTHDNPSIGQCAVTAVLINDLLGGVIHRMRIGDTDHYYNRVGGRVVDLTADQFEFEIEYADNDEETDSKRLREHPSTRRRYGLLAERFAGEADRSLPVSELEHVAIRDPNYVAGTHDRPEVAVFAQTRTDYTPLIDERMSPGQRVWMKWQGGPIVARSSVLSWHQGTFEDQNVNEVRELCLGTHLYGLDAYWSEVQDKHTGFTTVVRLRDEEWLDSLIYPAARSRGSSWVYLDTLRKKIVWLSLGWEPAPTPQDTRMSIPAGLRFRVLRRDDYTCRYCGARAPYVELHVDHVKPWVEVREHKYENLVAACSTCNLGKSDMRLPEVVMARLLAENDLRQGEHV